MVKYILNPISYCITSSNYRDPVFIGIGTSNPQKTLDLVGNLNVTGSIYNNGVPFTSSGLWTSGSNNAIYYTMGSVGIGSSQPSTILDLSQVRFYNTDPYGKISLGRESNLVHTVFIEGTGVLGKDAIRLRNQSSSIEMNSNLITFNIENEKLRMTSVGNVGFQTSPQQRCHVTNGSYFSSNLGIGTYIPSHKLHIYSTSQTDNDYETGGMLLENTVNGPIGVYLQNLNTSNQNKSWIIGLNSNSDRLDFIYGNYNTPNDVRMSIQTNGMIGIGTTYSAERLRVQGQAFFKNDHLVYGSLIISSNLTISSCNIIPMVTSAPHVTNNTTFTTYLSRCISTTSGAWWASATNPIYTSISMTKVSSETHSGGLLLPGGRVLFVPYTSNKLRIFDPKTNTVTTMDIPSGSALYSGAVLLKNGLVILAPYNNYIGFFNPINNIYTSTQYAQFNSADFRGAVLGNDGYVYFMPFNSIYSIGLYNPTNNLFGVITTTALPLNAYYGGVSLPDGRIIGVPHSATNVLIINTTGSYSLVGTTPGNQAYAGGVLLPDGRVLFVPYNRSTIGFFDPSTNSYTELSITVTTGSAPYFRGGVLTADNRVILSPYNSYNIGVYNITTNTYSEITTGLTSVNTFGANVMLLDGRVLFVPYSTGVTSAPIGIVSGFPKLPSELCFHPAFNKI